MYPPTTLITIAMSVNPTLVAQTTMPPSIVNDIPTVTIVDSEPSRMPPTVVPSIEPPRMMRLSRTQATFDTEPRIEPASFVPGSLTPGIVLLSSFSTHDAEPTIIPSGIGPGFVIPDSILTHETQPTIVLPEIGPGFVIPSSIPTDDDEPTNMPLPALSYSTFSSQTTPASRPHNITSRNSKDEIETYTIIANFNDSDTTCSSTFASFDLLNTGDCFPLSAYHYDNIGIRWGTGIHKMPCGVMVFKSNNCTGNRAVENWMPEPGQERDCRSMKAHGGPWGSMMHGRCCLEEGQPCWVRPPRQMQGG